MIRGIRRRLTCLAASIVAAGVFLVAGAAAPVAGTAPPASEYEVKAAFLYQFLKFADWPSANPDSSLRILVAGSDTVAAVLKTHLTGKSVRNRPIAVQQALDFSALPPSDLLFVSGIQRGEVTRLLARFHDQPVLTVGDERGFRDAGGMIELRVIDQRVRIRINLDATDAAGVRLHPSILTVADSVTRGGRAKDEAAR